MKYIIPVLLSAAFLMANPAPAAAALYRDLALGDQGLDVKELQMVLNQDIATAISLSGPGSKGLETIFFGSLTKQAVIRFQEKYSAEVLFPLGLVRGTGYVGTLTRQKINRLTSGGGSTGPVIANNTPVYIPPLPPPIDDSELNGKNTNEDEDEGESDTAPTRRPLADDNENLLNQTAQALVGFGAPERSKLMSIASVSPASGSPGTTITIKGRGFSSTNNKVYLGYDIKEGVSSAKDGTEIKVTIENPFSDSDYKTRASGRGSLEIPLGIMVENSSGLSNHFIFTLEF